MLRVQNISKTLPNGKELLRDISLEVQPGEFVAILGASGAGKSLCLRCILGLTNSTGRVSFTTSDGTECRLSELSGKELRRNRAKLGVIFQGLNLVKRLRVIENVMLGRLGGVSSLRSWCYGFTDEEARLALEALEKTNMAEHAHRYTGSLSGGEMQRVAIARAIHQAPEIYVADEPISSLDPGNAKAVMELLQPLSKTKPVLGVFHQPNMVARYCTRAIAIKNGRIVYDGDPKIDEATLHDIYGAELVDLKRQANESKQLATA